MGIATHNPSGMLWIVIATHSAMPTDGSVRAPTKVIKPSGKLWMANANATINPVLCNLDFSFILISSIVDKSSSAFAELELLSTNSLHTFFSWHSDFALVTLSNLGL